MELPQRPPTTDAEAEALIRQHPNEYFAEALIEMYGRLRKSLPVVNAWLEIAAAIRQAEANPPMTISQLITRLQALQTEHGDLPVYILGEDGREEPGVRYNIDDDIGYTRTYGPGIEIF